MLSLNVDLLKGRILRSLIIFAIPLFISSIFQQLYNTVDVMIVGNYLGDTSLAAIGASAAVYELLVGFSLGVGNGLSIVTARSFGSNNEEEVKKSVAGVISNRCRDNSFNNDNSTIIFVSFTRVIKYSFKYYRGIIFLYLYCNYVCSCYVFI